jgi:ribosomal protein L7Ae-like RNA K-turn-binding protein
MSRAQREKTETVRRLIGLARRARGVCVGSRDTRAGLRRGEIRLVLLATDGSPRDHERLARVSEEAGVPARTVATREEFGNWIGMGPVAVLGIRDAQLAAGVLSGLDESEGKTDVGTSRDAREPKRESKDTDSGGSE